jgi:hypothetical protein
MALERPNYRGVRVHVSTGYNRGEGNRRASRNRGVSDLPPEIPHVTIRNFCIAVSHAANTGGAQRALSVTQRALSVTQRALSVTQRALSVTQRALSVSPSELLESPS